MRHVYFGLVILLVFFEVLPLGLGVQNTPPKDACKDPLEETACPESAPRVAHREFAESIWALIKKGPSKETYKAVDTKIAAYLEGVQKRARTMDDTAIGIEVTRWAEARVKSKGYLNGLTGEAREPRTLDDLLANFIHLKRREYDEDAVQNIVGNIISVVGLRDVMFRTLINESQEGSSKSLEMLNESLLTYYQMIMIEEFKERLRDGKWTVFKTEDMKKQYQLKVEDAGYAEFRNTLLKSRSWQNFNVSTGKFEK